MESGAHRTPRSSLHIDPDRLSAILMTNSAPEGALRALHDAWSTSGRVSRSALFLSHQGDWTLVADSSLTGLRANSTILRHLDMSASRVDGTPMPIPRSHFLVYPLGSADDELARLVIQTRSQDVPPVLPADVFLSLSLYLRAVRDREALDSLASRGEFARRICVAEGRDRSVDSYEDFPEIIGRSKAMRSVLQLVRKAAPRDASILIQGESGTGKELIGQAIHRLSARSDEPFITENCAALTESLLEAELFGCEKGAYTGAESSRAGLFERGDRGTVFLDEIGEMSASLQTKLLRVLQEREVRRVGGSQTTPVNFRLIAATHRDLDEEALEDRFRLDLLYRIDVIRISVPPLRERPEDIPLLISYYLQEFGTSLGVPIPVVPEETLRVLTSYPWPGNVRELRNEIERAITLSPEIITPDSLSPRIERPVLPQSVAQRVRDEVGTNIYGLEKMVLGGIIKEILRETGGNKSAAARILGLPKTTLYRRMRRYGIG